VQSYDYIATSIIDGIDRARAIERDAGRGASELSARRGIAVDPDALLRVDARGDAMPSIVVYTSGWASVP